MKKIKKLKKRIQIIKGVITEASDIWSVKDKKGRRVDKAVVLIKAETADNPEIEPEAKVINIKGDLCNYAGCIGRRVKVEYCERVFHFVKNGISSLGFELYAMSIRFI